MAYHQRKSIVKIFVSGRVLWQSGLSWCLEQLHIIPELGFKFELFHSWTSFLLIHSGRQHVTAKRLDPYHPLGRTRWSSWPWLQCAPHLAIMSIWGITKQMEGLSIYGCIASKWKQMYTFFSASILLSITNISVFYQVNSIKMY